MVWPKNPRPAVAAVVLRNQVKALRPDLPDNGYGILGDANHATRFSDHNPWIRDAQGVGVARALDIPVKIGEGNRKLAERLRKLSKGSKLFNRKPHPSMGAYGYIISDGRIASANTNWKWIPYSGPDRHEKHVHVSFGRAQHRYDSPHKWALRKKDVPK